MESQTEALIQVNEEVEVQRELASLFERTLRLEYELELAIKIKD